MKADKRELAAALTRAAQATGSTPQMLSHIRLETVDGFLTVTATNLTVGYELTVAASGALKPVLVPAAVAKQVAVLPAETVELKIDKDRLVISGGSTFRVPIMPVDDWPATPDPNDGQVEAPERFPEWFAHAATHADQTGKRPHLAAVQYGPPLAATDSLRLAVVETTGPEVPILIPATVRVMDPIDTIRWDTRHVMFEGPAGKQWARLVDAKYPEWRKLFTKDKPACSLTFNAAALDALTGRAQMVAEDKSAMVFTPGTETVTLTISTRRGSFTEDIDAKVEGTLETPVGLNPGFVRQALGPVSGDVTFEVWDERKPVVVRAGEWTSLVMPNIGGQGE